jgi:hypothetical protein
MPASLENALKNHELFERIGCGGQPFCVRFIG